MNLTDSVDLWIFCFVSLTKYLKSFSSPSMPYKIIVIKYYRILLLNFVGGEDLVTDISLLADSATPRLVPPSGLRLSSPLLAAQTTDFDAFASPPLFVGGRGLEPLTSSTSTKRFTN